MSDYSQIAHLVTTQRKLFTIAWLMVVVLLSSGLAKLEVTPDNRVFYSSENERFQDLLDFESTFIPNNNIIFVIHDKQGTSSNLPEATRWLDTQAWRIPNTLRVDSIASYPVVARSAGDEVEISDLLSVLCESKSACDLSSSWPSDYPEIIGRLTNGDSTALAVVLTLNVEIGTTTEIGEINKASRLLESEFEQEFPGLELYHTGGVPMMQAFGEASNDDLARLLPIALISILLICTIMLGSFKMTALLTTLGTTAALSTLGIAGHVGVTINTATSATAIIVFTVVVASTMHVVVSYINDSRLYDLNTAAENALSINTKPVILATLTSVAGFLSLLFADAPPLNELGALSAVGVTIGGIQALTVAPALLPKIDPPKTRRYGAEKIAEWLAKDRPIHHAVIPVLSLVAISAMGLNHLKVNDDFVDYFDERYSFRVDTDKIEQLLASPNHIELLVSTDSSAGVYDPEYISYLFNLQERLRAQPIVASAFGYTDILEKVAKISDVALSEASADELAQLFLIYELSLKTGQSTNDFIAANKSSARIAVLLKRSDSSQINSLKEKIENWDDAESLGVRVTVTGENIPVANLTELNASNMAIGIAISIALATFAISFVYKSLFLGVIGFTAIMLPIVAAFGLWGWVFGEIGLAAVVVVSVTLGIVIDDAIHFLSRFHSFYENNARSVIEATALSVRVVGAAIVVTSLALMVGFSAMSTSGFGINAALGICTVLVLGFSLLIDLTLVPAAIRRLPERRALSS